MPFNLSAFPLWILINNYLGLNVLKIMKNNFLVLAMLFIGSDGTQSGCKLFDIFFFGHNHGYTVTLK